MFHVRYTLSFMFMWGTQENGLEFSDAVVAAFIRYSLVKLVVGAGNELIERQAQGLRIDVLVIRIWLQSYGD